MENNSIESGISFVRVTSSDLVEWRDPEPGIATREGRKVGHVVVEILYEQRSGWNLGSLEL